MEAPSSAKGWAPAGGGAQTRDQGRGTTSEQRTVGPTRAHGRTRKYVYAVVHDATGFFLIGKKRIKGYFFSTHGGRIEKDGQQLHGAGGFALPGGERNDDEPILRGCLREFYEETNYRLGPKDYQKYTEKEFEPEYAAGYFLVDTGHLWLIQKQVSANLQNARAVAALFETASAVTRIFKAVEMLHEIINMTADITGKLADTTDEITATHAAAEGLRDYIAGIKKDYFDKLASISEITGNYERLHQFCSIPQDNELDDLGAANIHENWEKIQPWKSSHDRGWFYCILEHLKFSVLSSPNVSQLESK